MIIQNPQYPFQVDTKNPEHRKFFKSMQIEIWSSGRFQDWAREKDNTDQAIELFPIDTQQTDIGELLDFLNWVHKWKLPDDEGPFAFTCEVFKSWEEVLEKYKNTRLNPDSEFVPPFEEWLGENYPFGVIIDPEKNRIFLAED
jgi:hypothetical protein